MSTEKRMVPEIHEDFKINQRVTFDNGEVKGSGEIIGIALMHMAFIYIVLLDKPVEVDGFDVPWKAICIDGTRLTKELPTWLRCPVTKESPYVTN